MNRRHSSGFTSVPVAIMSTVTATRGLYELRKLLSRSSGEAPVVFDVIFRQKSLPLPNSSLTIFTMSSAWLSCFAKTRVFGDFGAPSKDLREQVLPEGAHDEPDLVRGDHVAVKLGLPCR